MTGYFDISDDENSGDDDGTGKGKDKGKATETNNAKTGRKRKFGDRDGTQQCDSDDECIGKRRSDDSGGDLDDEGIGKGKGKGKGEIDVAEGPPLVLVGIIIAVIAYVAWSMFQ